MSAACANSCVLVCPKIKEFRFMFAYSVFNLFLFGFNACSFLFLHVFFVCSLKFLYFVVDFALFPFACSY